MKKLLISLCFCLTVSGQSIMQRLNQTVYSYTGTPANDAIGQSKLKLLLILAASQYIVDEKGNLVPVAPPSATPAPIILSGPVSKIISPTVIMIENMSVKLLKNRPSLEVGDKVSISAVKYKPGSAPGTPDSLLYLEVDAGAKRGQPPINRPTPDQILVFLKSGKSLKIIQQPLLGALPNGPPPVTYTLTW
jgi:hypothetical protein